MNSARDPRKKGQTPKRSFSVQSKPILTVKLHVTSINPKKTNNIISKVVIIIRVLLTDVFKMFVNGLFEESLIPLSWII